MKEKDFKFEETIEHEGTSAEAAMLHIAQKHPEKALNILFHVLDGALAGLPSDQKDWRSNIEYSQVLLILRSLDATSRLIAEYMTAD